LIADATALGALVDRLRNEPVIALDTEADSLHSYFEKLCLIQISIRDEHFLVDPLAQVPLEPLYELLNAKPLILHGADYDVRLLGRNWPFTFPTLFDTMLAARLCGHAELGLAALVEKFFHVKLSKASQKANWAIRPLSAQMLEYAINDTRYLMDLADILDDQLATLGRSGWFRESCERMIASAREPRAKDESKVWRITGSSALSPRAQSILRVLWHWRDAEARAWDRPPFHVVSNEDLIRIADKATRGEAYSTPRMNGRRRRSFEIVLALALNIPESEWPKPEKTRRRKATREQIACFESLKRRRDDAARDLNLDPSIVASRGALEAAALDPATPLLMNWQRGLIGLEPLATPHAA
jgi:ribonuclease D